MLCKKINLVHLKRIDIHGYNPQIDCIDICLLPFSMFCFRSEETEQVYSIREELTVKYTSVTSAW